jgi:hypothetical protein
MMRWKIVVVGLALTFAVAAGCKQQLFISECDYDHYKDIGIPPRGECNPDIHPSKADVPSPPTVLDLNRKERPLTLAEAVSIALEHGTTGIQSVRLFGTANDDLPGSPGPVQGPLQPNTDSIRVLALEPAVLGKDVEGRCPSSTPTGGPA